MGLAIRHDRGYNAEEIVVERPDGTRLTVLAHANPIHDDAGKVIAAVSVLVDITEPKHAEERLIEADRSKNEFWRCWRTDCAILLRRCTTHCG